MSPAHAPPSPLLPNPHPPNSLPIPIPPPAPYPNRNSQIGDAGATALAAGIAPLTALRLLNLSYAARAGGSKEGKGERGSEGNAAVRRGHTKGVKGGSGVVEGGRGKGGKQGARALVYVLLSRSHSLTHPPTHSLWL